MYVCVCVREGGGVMGWAADVDWDDHPVVFQDVDLFRPPSDILVVVLSLCR